MDKFRILIVEDNGLFRQTLRESLQKSFPEIAVDEAAEGGESLQKVDAFLPDLVFVDIRLPGENGLELIKKIKATHPDITIFILTDYDTPEYRKAASGMERHRPQKGTYSTGRSQDRKDKKHRFKRRHDNPTPKPSCKVPVCFPQQAREAFQGY